MLCNGFEWTGQPQKLPFPLGRQPNGCFNSSESPPNGISISSAVSAGHICVTNTETDRQTDRETALHVTSVAVGRVYAMHGMRHKKTAASHD